MEESKPAMPREIDDEKLGDVNGGTLARMQDGKYYFQLKQSDEDYYNKYLCPNCGRSVHPSGMGWYRCDDCRESWFFECNLRLNLESGVWMEISEKEYYALR